MGSSSQANTNAVDNRQALTDTAVGYSAYGGSGNQAAFAPLSNLRSGRDLTINSLDGGAIDQSFEFAKSTMSQALAGIMDTSKAAQASADRIQDTAYSALQEAADKTAAAGNDSLMQAGKGLLLVIALLGIAYFWNKRGK